MILASGTEQFCIDLNVDPSDVVMLVVAYHLKAPKMCQFTQTGWVEGWRELECHSLEALQAKLPALRKELENNEIFRKIYAFTFDFSREENQKGLRKCDNGYSNSHDYSHSC